MEKLPESERCYFRHFTDADADGFVRLNQHPDILRFTGDQPFQHRAEALQFIRDYEANRLPGWGRWSVVIKSTNRWIGWCGLRKQITGFSPDLGFRFLPEFWGQGLATETAHAFIQHGFNEGLDRIYARTHPENERAKRVLHKLKMICEGPLAAEDRPWIGYHIDPPEIR